MTSDLRRVSIPALNAVAGLVHGFERRRDDGARETREHSRRRVTRALAGAGKLLLLQQVHGATVRQAPWDGTLPEGDAAVCAEADYVLGIETADCLPVLLVDPRRGAIGAAHAGWRGSVAGVVRAALDALIALGSRPEDVVAALGPSIGACCYEVGDDVRGAFDAAFGHAAGAFFRPGRRGRAHLDVRAANVWQLVQAGVREDHVHHVAECTCCRPDLYHSYRRDGPGGGRMVSFVGRLR